MGLKEYILRGLKVQNLNIYTSTCQAPQTRKNGKVTCKKAIFAAQPPPLSLASSREHATCEFSCPHP